MTTLRLSPADDLSAEDRATLEAAARRLGTTPDRLHGIWAAQLHWPRYLESNHRQGLHGYMLRGDLPALTKEAMHVAVSMANSCEY
jgi:alkylhydroperoxidase family enzyme